MTETAADIPLSAARRVPVTAITGFLGSGKTTLLNRLLRQPGMAGAAVIVNEFGEVGIDHLLVGKVPGDAVLLASGCLCCAVRGDLVDTMGIMAWQADNGEIPAFDRLVVETSGLADPAPVLQTVMSDPALAGRYRLNGMATTVDAVNGAGQLAGFPEALKQVALASRLLVTKTDIAAPAAAAALEAELRRLNAAAPLYRVANGGIDAALLFADGDYDPASAGDAARWLGAGAAHGHGQHDHAGHDHAGHDGHDHAPEDAHDGGIRSFCLAREAPVPWQALRDWLESLTSLRGADLLRVKGIVNVAGRAAPVAIHGVQHVFHPPRLLDAWPDADRRTRIVCIVRGLEEEALSNALDAAIENLSNRAA